VKKAVALVLVVSLLGQSGCALIARGTTEKVDIQGKGLEVDGVREDSGTFDLRRRQVHVLSANVNGQRTTRTLESDIQPLWFGLDLAIFGVLLAPIGSVAFLVDFATGSLNEFETTQVSFDDDAAGSKAPTAPAALCAHCGTRFAEGSKFCSECGARRPTGAEPHGESSPTPPVRNTEDR
jgi:hypothetical protein